MSDVIHLSNFIAGNWQPSLCEHWIENFSRPPVSTSQTFPSSEDTFDLAVEAALDAAEQWSQFSINERADWLEKIADELEQRTDEIAQLESLDTGKPITLARNVDAARSVANFRFFAEQGREFESEIFEMSDATNRVLYKPVGVAGLITPWNLPLYLLSWKVAPALLMGNTIVAKPSEMTPMTASLLAEVIEDVGLPSGVFNLVHGNGLDAGAPLTAHPDVNLISFTGGTTTGREVAKSASSAFKKLSLNLVGKMRPSFVKMWILNP